MLPGSLSPGPAGAGFRSAALRPGAAGTGAPGRGAVGAERYGIGHDPRDGAAHGGGPADRRLRHRRRAATFRDTRPRTSSTRPRIRSTCPGHAGSSSRSTGSSSAWRSATRAGAIPRRCDGRRCGARRSSSIPSTRGATRERRPSDAVGRGRRAVLREGDDDAQHREHDLLRQRQLRACASRNRRPASSPRRASARRTCPTGRKACWCRRSTRQATGLLATRYAPERYAEQSMSPVFVAKRRFDPQRERTLDALHRLVGPQSAA